MSGVIDEDGQQWERCNGCIRFTRVEGLEYEDPTETYPYGRDLCSECYGLVIGNPGRKLYPDMEELERIERAKLAYQETMRGKAWAFTDNPDGSTSCHIVDVN